MYETTHLGHFPLENGSARWHTNVQNAVASTSQPA